MSGTLFVSYAHNDNEPGHWQERLAVFLDGVEGELPLDWWADSKLKMGEKWEAKIEEALAQAKGAVLLVGPHFLRSDFICERELPALLKAHKDDGLRLFPLIVGYCPWKESILKDYQPFNPPEEPLRAQAESEQDKSLNDFVLQIVAELREANLMAEKEEVAANELLPAMREIAQHLGDTRTAFLSQASRRDDLVARIRERLGDTKSFQYEKFFFRYFPEMTREELFDFQNIRGFTEGRLRKGNQIILDILESQPAIRDELPILGALRRHLVVWLDKYETVFEKNEAMSVLYVGVEDRVPFPKGADKRVAAWIAQNEE